MTSAIKNKLTRTQEGDVRTVTKAREIRPMTERKHIVSVNLEDLDKELVRNRQAKVYEFTHWGMSVAYALPDDETFQKLANILRSSPRMEDLTIACTECGNLTDSGVRYIAEAIKTLKCLKRIDLTFANCPEVS